MALVLGNSSAGDEVSAVAREVARDDEAWREREITVDGEVVMAREREFASRWVAYYLTPLLIVYVLAPVELRPEVLKLRRFEVPRRESAATRPEELQPDSARFPGEEPLQLYKLVGSFVGERLRGVEGWGMGGMVHRPAGVKGELNVTVTRRATARVEKGAHRGATPDDAARGHVAMLLVLDNPSAGNDIFAAAKEVASDDRAWRPREINVDGEVVSGYEREFGDRWVAYYLTPLLIVSVLAPVELCPDVVELSRLEPDEVARMDTISDRLVPRYVLAGSFVGERLDEGYGGGVCEIAHVPAGLDGELMVRVATRLTSRSGRDSPWVALPADLARRDPAFGLVLDDSSAGDGIFAVAEEVASDDEAWGAREIVVDGEVVEGYEAEFGGRWVAYYLTPVLIVSVRGPVALRPETVELRELPPGEVLPSRLNEE